MKATAYLTIVPKFRPDPWWSKGGDQVLDSIKVSKVTSKQPTGLGVVVKVTLDVPDSAFLPFKAAAIVELAAGDLTVNVTVEPPDSES